MRIDETCEVSSEACELSNATTTTDPTPVLDAAERAAQRKALTRLFSEEFSAVYSFVLARSGSPAVAEDVASETFTDAARAARDGRGAELTRSWLLMVARRRLIDFWRSDERHRRRINRVRAERSVHEQTGDDTLDSERRVLLALDALPTRQRAALTMRYLDELSVAEVAETLDVSYRAAESLLSRGRTGFARAYKEQR